MNLIVEYNLPFFFLDSITLFLRHQLEKFFAEECKQRDIYWYLVLQKYTHNGWRKVQSHLEQSININNKVVQMEPQKPLVKHIIPKECLQNLGLQWFLFFMCFLLLSFPSSSSTSRFSKSLSFDIIKVNPEHSKLQDRW